MTKSTGLLKVRATADSEGCFDGGPPPQFDFPQELGLGITRSTGNVIALLLHTEEPGSRASILAWAAKDMGITLSDLVREYQDA